jgi:hypothetical protein
MPTEFTQELVDAFWSRVSVATPDDCWEWQRARTKAGYGVFWFHQQHWYAHRFVMALAGHELDGLYVCHTCDNPPCCNPSHLFVGTAQANSLDMYAKGRHPKSWLMGPAPWRYAPGDNQGEAGWNAKLTSERVKEIRERHTNGERPTDIARRFGVHRATVNDVIARRTWKHVH